MLPTVRLLLAGVALCGSIAACGRTASLAGRQVAPPARVQELRVAAGEDPFLRGRPPIPNVGLVASGPNPGIFETITRLTPSFGVAPGLAVRWEAVAPTHWRFELREDVTFHDGTPFDASAVVATLDRLALRQTPPRGLSPGSARAVGPLVVEVHLTVPNLRLAEQLTNPALAVQRPGTEAGAGGEPSRIPTGTGPFRFTSYTPGSELRVTVNENYWGRRPRLASIVFRFGSAADASRLLAVRQVDAVGLVPFDSLAAVEGGTDRAVASTPSRSAHLLLNVGGPEPWATLKEDALRRAVSVAIDRRAVSVAWHDHARASDSVVPPVVLADSAARISAPPHDRRRAAGLLDAAGWTAGTDGVRSRDGRRLSLSLLLARPAETRQSAEIIRRHLAAVGIEVMVEEAADTTAALLRVNSGTFDAVLDVGAQDDANPCALCRLFSIRPGGQLTVAGTVTPGPGADELFEAAYAAPSVDAARRHAADLMQLVVGDRVVAVPLAVLPTVWLVSPRVRAFDAAAVPGAQRWEEVWLSS